MLDYTREEMGEICRNECYGEILGLIWDSAQQHCHKFGQAVLA